MLFNSIKKHIRKKIQHYEGNILHMYLDSKGYITVGVGCLIDSVSKAQKLPFINAKTKRKATPIEIKADYDNVKKQYNKTATYRASYYKKHTKLILTQTEIDNLFNRQIAGFYKELKKIYLHFDTYPPEVQFA